MRLGEVKRLLRGRTESQGQVGLEVLLTSDHARMLRTCRPPRPLRLPNPLSCPPVAVCSATPGPQARSEGSAISVLPLVVCRRALIFSPPALPPESRVAGMMARTLCRARGSDPATCLWSDRSRPAGSPPVWMCRQTKGRDLAPGPFPSMAQPSPPNRRPQRPGKLQLVHLKKAPLPQRALFPRSDGMERGFTPACSRDMQHGVQTDMAPWTLKRGRKGGKRARGANLLPSALGTGRGREGVPDTRLRPRSFD